METLLHSAVDRLRAGADVMLATVIATQGHTPRPAGSWMLLGAGGPPIGSIGGGLVEAHVLSWAAVLVGQHRSVLLRFDLSETAPMQLACGGVMGILLSYWPAHDARLLAVLEGWLAARQARCRAHLLLAWQPMSDDASATRPPEFAGLPGAADNQPVTVGRCLFDTASGEGLGDWHPDTDICQRIMGTHTWPARGLVAMSARDIWTERCGREGRVLILGAGHVAVALARLAATVDFQVVVFDDRPEYADPVRFPDGTEVRVLASFADCFAGLSHAPDDYVVIATRGHEHDRTVLRQALRGKMDYIGMMSSPEKKAAVFQSLRTEGFDPDALARIHTPIGVPIRSDTPEEIAVSITAELILERARRRMRQGG